MAPMNQMLFVPEYDDFRSRVTAEPKKRCMLLSCFQRSRRLSLWTGVMLPMTIATH